MTKVLLVDDEGPFVDALSRRLAKREMDVVGALSGPEALQKLQEDHRIEVVILDVKMPGMDGIQTLKAIKAEHPLVEVIMLTGHATVETAIDGMKLGALDYLMKPCDIDVLVAKVQEAASKKRKHEDKIAEARAQSIALRRGD
ncbi:MAG: response regulator [Desulfomonile sp.]|nr:response regulator [Desulfomonile sp.]